MGLPPSSSMPWSIRDHESASTRLVGVDEGSGTGAQICGRRRRMSTRSEVGIDVSKKVLDVAARRDERLETARFDNDATGHRKLVAWLTKRSRTARVVLESTGTYSLDVALALQRTKGIDLMV